MTTKAAPDGPHARQHRPRVPLGWIGLAVCMVMGSALMLPAPDTASATRPLTVSLTFDDGSADQMAAHQLLKSHGMVGTFYINSSFIGSPGFMTRADLETLKANGHEIGGHSFNHSSLTSLSAGEANRQICADRNTLLSWGYAVTSFAYPFSDFNPSVKSTVQACGYNSARAVGGLRSPHSCTECPAAEPFPPADLYATRTPDDINTTWTLQDLKKTVTRAESNGGWLAFNFHHVCDACDVRSIRASVLDQFLAWLQPRSGPTIRTNVKTVQQVVTGSVKPPVAPTPPPPPGEPGVNTVQNASLEAVSSMNRDLPRCFTNSAGYGTNSVTYRRVNDAHSGSFGEQVTMTSRTDGDAKLVQVWDLGECSSQVASGQHYEVSAWYKSNVEVFFTLYKRDAIGQWTYWTQSPRIAPATRWTRATWISPTPPADVVAVNFGLTIDRVGTLTTDDYGFADTPGLPPPAPPGVNAIKNSSLETDGSGAFPACWTGAGYGTNAVVWKRVTDAKDGQYAEKLDMTRRTDGDAKLIPIMDSANCSPTVTADRPYVLGVYKSTAPTFFTLYRQDANGVWSYWMQSPRFAASDTYVAVTWESPPVPAGTVAMTFGLTLDSVGSVTTDNYSLVAT